MVAQAGLGLGGLGLGLVGLPLERAQAGEGLAAVVLLAAGGARANLQAARRVNRPHGARRLVDVLTAGAARRVATLSPVITVKR